MAVRCCKSLLSTHLSHAVVNMNSNSLGSSAKLKSLIPGAQDWPAFVDNL